jgi:polyhydroxybutyrate depolymerase
MDVMRMPRHASRYACSLPVAFLAAAAIALLVTGCTAGARFPGASTSTTGVQTPTSVGATPSTGVPSPSTTVPSQGGRRGAVRPGDSRQRLDSGGRNRTFLVHVPSGYTGDEAVPLVISYHAFLGTGASQARMTGMSAVADQNGFIVVYPDGVRRSWNDSGGLTGEDSSPDDLTFTRDLIAYLESEYNIDAKRVYATGMSNGGFMCYRLARDLSDLIAAVAPVAALPSTTLTAGGSWPAPMPVMVIQGTADPIVPYNGGAVGPKLLNQQRVLMSAPDTASFFAELDKCSIPGTTEPIPDTDPNDGANASRLTYSGGTNGSEVVLITVEGGGHTWPGGTQYLPGLVVGPVCRDFDASQTIWDFFAKHPKG